MQNNHFHILYKSHLITHLYKKLTLISFLNWISRFTIQLLTLIATAKSSTIVIPHESAADQSLSRPVTLRVSSTPCMTSLIGNFQARKMSCYRSAKLAEKPVDRVENSNAWAIKWRKEKEPRARWEKEKGSRGAHADVCGCALRRVMYFARFETGIITVSSLFDAINMKIVAYVNYSIFIVVTIKRVAFTRINNVAMLIHYSYMYIAHMYIMYVQLIKDHLCMRIYRNSLDLRDPARLRRRRITQ